MEEGERNLREEVLPHQEAVVLILLGVAVLLGRPPQTKEGVEVSFDCAPLPLNCCHSCLT